MLVSAPPLPSQELESLKRATEDLERARRRLDKAMQESDYEEAGKLQYVTAGARARFSLVLLFPAARNSIASTG